VCPLDITYIQQYMGRQSHTAEEYLRQTPATLPMIINVLEVEIYLINVLEVEILPKKSAMSLFFIGGRGGRMYCVVFRVCAVSGVFMMAQWQGLVLDDIVVF